MFANVKFEVTAGLYQDFFNYLVQNEYRITDIKNSAFGFTAICSGKDYINFAKAAKKYQCKIKIIKKYGIYFKVREILKHKGALAGIFLSYFLVLFFNNIVWNINIDTDDEIIKNKIAIELFENGISPGTIYNQQKFADAQINIMMNEDDIGFITLNFYKGSLDCRINKKEKIKPYLSESHTGDILATESGVIKDLRVYNGTCNVQLEQNVSKGDLLVCAINPITFQYTPTRAYIVAICNREYCVTVPFNKTVNVLTGNTSKSKVYYLFNHIFEDSNVVCFEKYDTMTKIEYLKIMGFCLPITLKTDYFIEKKEMEISKDLLTAQYAAKDEIERMILKDNKIVEQLGREYQYDINEEGITVRCILSCYYDIT